MTSKELPYHYRVIVCQLGVHTVSQDIIGDTDIQNVNKSHRLLTITRNLHGVVGSVSAIS